MKTMEQTLDKYLEKEAERENLLALALDMGRVIRLLDEAGAHSELWTQDGDYVIDGRFPK